MLSAAVFVQTNGFECSLDLFPSTMTPALACARQGFDLQLTQYDERGWRATQWAAW